MAGRFSLPSKMTHMTYTKRIQWVFWSSASRNDGKKDADVVKRTMFSVGRKTGYELQALVSTSDNFYCMPDDPPGASPARVRVAL